MYGRSCIRCLKTVWKGRGNDGKIALKISRRSAPKFSASPPIGFSSLWSYLSAKVKTVPNRSPYNRPTKTEIVGGLETGKLVDPGSHSGFDVGLACGQDRRSEDRTSSDRLVHYPSKKIWFPYGKNIKLCAKQSRILPSILTLRRHWLVERVWMKTHGFWCFKPSFLEIPSKIFNRRFGYHSTFFFTCLGSWAAIQEGNCRVGVGRGLCLDTVPLRR